MSIGAYYLAVAPILVGLILVLLLSATRRGSSGVISARRTPVNPPAPTRLMSLTKRQKP